MSGFNCEGAIYRGMSAVANGAGGATGGSSASTIALLQSEREHISKIASTLER